MQSDKIAILVVTGLHLVVSGFHGYAHKMANVPLLAWQTAFVAIVILAMPVVAAYIAWFRNLKTGAILFSLSMASSMVFGYYHHFVFESPDLHSNVTGPFAGLFFHSSAMLAIIEFAGFLVGALAYLRK